MTRLFPLGSALVLETPGGAPPYGAPPQQYHQGPPGGPPVGKTSGKATAALVVGIVSICLCWILVVNVVSVIGGIVAVVLGVLANKEIDAGGGAVQGKGMAITGIILGALAALIAIAMLTFLAAIFQDIMDQIENQTAEQIALLVG